MKLNELYLLTESDINIIVEQLDTELKKMIDAKIKGPVNKAMDSVTSSLADKLAPKIKAWAMEKISFAKEHGYDTTIIKKLINDPKQSTEQIIKNIIKQKELS